MKLSFEVNKILKRLKNGENCFEKLYDMTYKHLLVIARLYLKDKSFADDVLSEAYISVYKNIYAFNEEKNGYNWLCKIVQNKAYNFNVSAFYFEQLNENTENVCDVFDDAIMKCDIAKVLSALGKDEQELIYLKFFKDKTYQEIAKTRNVSAPMIHKSLKKIMKKIEKLLKNFTNG